MPMDSSGWDPNGPNARNHWSGLSIDLHLAMRAASGRLEREFHGVFDTATVRRYLYTSHDRFAADSAITRFLRAERFTRQQLQALARMQDRPTAASAQVVLFLSTRNAGRSPMAIGFFQHLAEDRAIAWSGGPQPADELHPAAIAAMRERGIDIAGEFPKPWTTEAIHAADMVITMGCADTCPIDPGRRHLDWGVDDPGRLDLEGIRPIRDEIERRVRELLEQLGIPTDP